MKVYEIVYRNYLVGSDVLERTVTVKGWIRKCMKLSSLKKDKKIIVSVSKIVI